MRFVCESCRAQYMINDEKVGLKGVKVRCRKCGYVILVKRGGEPSAKAPVISAAADPDDAQATQILQTPLVAAPQPSAKPKSNAQRGDPKDSLLGDAGDDEIGAVFDQVLNSGAHSISKGSADDRRTEVHAAVTGSELGDDDNDDRMSTRVLDADVVRKLVAESGKMSADKGPQRDPKPEKNGRTVEGEVPQNDWFVAIDEKQTGPLALEKVKEHWDRGEIGPDSLCWRAGFTDWVPLSDVAQLASVLAPRPASKPIMMNVPNGPSVVSVPVESAFSAGGVMKSVRSEVQVPMSGTARPEETGSWRPTSLGSLVQDEMAALSRPAPRVSDNSGSSEVSMKGLLDIPPPDHKPPANGRTNGRGGASAEHLPHAPASRSSGPHASGAPANPYVATPGASYSSPGITQYRPEKDRSNIMVWVALTVGGMLVLTLLGLVIWLANKQQAPVVQAQPVPQVIAQAPTQAPTPAVAVQPAPVPTAQPVPVPDALGQQPVAAAVPSTAATPTGPLPPNAKPPPQQPPPRTGTRTLGSTNSGSTNSGSTNSGSTAKVAAAPAEKAEKAEKPAPAPDKKSAKSDDDEFEREFGGGGTKETPKTAVTERKKATPYVPPAPGAASNDVKEALGQADVIEVVSGFKPALTRCVEEQRKKEPGITGKLVMKWSIQTSGKTSNVSVQSEEFKATYMAGCVGALIKTWTFPKHKVAGDPIVFPFKF